MVATQKAVRSFNLPVELMEQVEKFAQQDQRNLSNAVAKLLAESLGNKVSLK